MIAHPETRARLQTVCIALVALVAVVTAMRLAKGLLAPVTLGLIVAIVAAPGMRLLARLGIPRAVSASISLVFVGALTMLLIAGLGPIVMDLIGQVPRIEDEIRWWVIDASRAIRGLESVQFELEQSLTEDGEAVEEAMPSLLDAVSVAPNFAAQLLTFTGTFFFFTLTQNEIYASIKSQAAALRQADKAVSHYFLTVTAINAGLGVAVFATMTIIGIPNPILWGAAAFILNFVLYLGPVMLLVALGVAGFTEFNGRVFAFAGPGVFSVEHDRSAIRNTDPCWTTPATQPTCCFPRYPFRALALGSDRRHRFAPAFGVGDSVFGSSTFPALRT